MQREGREETEEMSSPEVRESTPHGDATRSVAMGYLLHYLKLGE